MLWRLVQELIAKNAESPLPSAELQALKGTGHLPIFTRSVCDLLHPGQSCAGHLAQFLPSAYLRAFPVYLPVYIIPAILVHRKNFFIQPKQILLKFLKGCLRSSSFLALLIGLAYSGEHSTSLLRNFFPMNNSPAHALDGEYHYQCRQLFCTNKCAQVCCYNSFIS